MARIEADFIEQWFHDVLIVLPPRHEGDAVDAAHLLAVRKHLLENDLLDEASFERLLMGAKPTAASQ